jgi:hypothetical protein
VAKKKTYSARKAVRRVARERVGTVPETQVIIPKTQRKKPKHKASLLEEESGS